MNAALPDVSLNDIAPVLSPLAWVGMQGIDLPITVAEPNYRRDLHARADVQVDLPDPQAKGIHMSRLILLLDDLFEDEKLSPAGLCKILQAMIDSHTDCKSRCARLGLSFDLLLRRPALVTQGLSGWKSYPVRLDAELTHGVFRCRVQVRVGYSSTCPCSAALARQLIERAFLDAFGQQAQVDSNHVAQWLHSHASLATPHGQRSEAHVTVDATDSGERFGFGLLPLINCIEQAVATPLQTAVKRADEQAFAALNGQNLMFVEDAARRIEAALSGYSNLSVHVRHLESLHPHDAVAWATPKQEGATA